MNKPSNNLLQVNKIGKCQQSGMCCHTTITGKITSCRYLKDLGNGKTKCTIYHRRLGTVIAVNKETGEYKLCGMRSEAEYDYDGCELNKGLPSFVDHCKEVMKKYNEDKNGDNN